MNQLGFQPHESDDDEDGSEDGDADSELNEDRNKGKSRAPRNSKFDGVIKPTTLWFYTGTTKAALIEAKKLYRREVMLKNLFPTREDDLGDATRCLSNIIKKFRDEGRVFPRGMWFPYLCYAIIDSDIF